MRRALAFVGVGLLGVAVGVAVGRANPPAPQHQQAELAGWSVLAATTTRAGTPPSGAFFTAANLATAAANGVPVPADGPPIFHSQPVQGISAVVPARARRVVGAGRQRLRHP